MGTVVPPSDQTAELLQKLSLDPQNNTLQVPNPTKKYDSSTLANGMNKPFERSTTPIHQDFMDPNMFYNPSGYSSTYYYGGYDGSSTDWDRYATPDGSVYGDYQHGYGYAPYGTYSPSGSSVGHDNQLYGQQHYQYPTSYYQTSSTSNNQTNASQPEASTPIGAGQIPTARGDQNRIGNSSINRGDMSKSLRPNYHNPPMKSSSSYGWGDFSSANSAAVAHGNNYASMRNQNMQPMPPFMGLQYPGGTSGLGQAGYMNRYYRNNRGYGQYGSTFGSNNYDPRISGRGWLGLDNKYRPRGRSGGSFGYSNDSGDGFNELNRGPRAKSFKDQNDSEEVTSAMKGQSLPVKENSSEDNLPLFPDREQYNKDEFPETYPVAKFFVIKSYSEDDIHKSIKYGVWASTPNGNKKLDAAYKEAQEKSGGCPMFLLFSVNASGQFVGLAEMVGPVDFEKSLEYWQQDKWTGCFPVKWHIIKDVPNSILRHITLENNENKPVTNSRDTQEVGLSQGNQILKIFKTHSSKTSILDDFEFYEGRQKTMQEKKAKQRQLNKEVGMLKGIDAASAENVGKDGSLDKQGPHKSGEGSTDLTAGSDIMMASVSTKLLGESGSVVTAEDASKG